MFQVGWTAQPVWKETTCMARQSEEDDTLKLEVNKIEENKEKDRQRDRQAKTKTKTVERKKRKRERQTKTKTIFCLCKLCSAICGAIVASQ